METISMDIFQKETRVMLDLLKRLVEIESPSTNKIAVDRLGIYICGELQKLDAEITIHPRLETGDNIIARWGSGPGGILVLCHMDTVFNLGTLASNPLVEKDDTLYGPGVMDMKGGIAVFLSAMRLLRSRNILLKRPLTAIFNSDEEIGSLGSRAIIEEMARQSEVVFTLEPAFPNGALKTARKGVGEIEINTGGVAAHAGVDHARGRNAIEELAYHILSAQKLTDYSTGTTVNVGTISGGSRTNVVPDKAQAVADFRVSIPEEVHRLENWANTLQPVLPGTSVTAKVNLNRPPMPRDATMIATFQKAQSIASKLGLTLLEASTGGASDANFVAPLGVPVLDGLGVVGDGAHSEREYMIISSLPERAALLAALLTGW